MHINRGTDLVGDNSVNANPIWDSASNATESFRIRAQFVAIGGRQHDVICQKLTIYLFFSATSQNDDISSIISDHVDHRPKSVAGSVGP